MQFTENAVNVMAARIYKGIGRAWIVKNLSTPKPEDAIVKLISLYTTPTPLSYATDLIA